MKNMYIASRKKPKLSITNRIDIVIDMEENNT